MSLPYAMTIDLNVLDHLDIGRIVHEYTLIKSAQECYAEYLECSKQLDKLGKNQEML